eukprot:1043604-Rhodomonas_salina.2
MLPRDTARVSRDTLHIFRVSVLGCRGPGSRVQGLGRPVPSSDAVDDLSQLLEPRPRIEV